MKIKNLLLITLLLFISKTNFAQEKAKNQKALLSKYIGTWYSADKITDTKIGINPNIKMRVVPKMNNGALQVEVFQKNNKIWNTILVELLAYDAASDQIVAAGHNASGGNFTGKGFFDTENNWHMDDLDLNSQPTLHVEFNFLNENEVVLKGTVPNSGTGGFDVKYIKKAK
jgi:hypothetical protein